MPCSKIEDELTLALLYVVHRTQVSLSQIHDVQVVAYSRSIRSVVVVAEHGQLLSSANSDLANVWHKIVGDAIRVLADETRRVRAYGIEVSQDHHTPIRVLLRRVEVLEHFFDHELATSVRICDSHSHLRILSKRHFRHATVYGGRAAENDRMAIVLVEQLQQSQCTTHIVGVVLQRRRCTFADSL